MFYWYPYECWDDPDGADLFPNDGEDGHDDEESFLEYCMNHF